MLFTHLAKQLFRIWLTPTVLIITLTAVTTHFDYALGSSIHTPEEFHRHISDTCAAKHYNASQHSTFVIDISTGTNKMTTLYDADYNIGGTLVLVSSLRTGGLFTLTALYITTAFVLIPALCIIGLPVTRGTYTKHETCSLYLKAFVDQIFIRLAFEISIVF
jgi:hypothetical protein